MTKLAVVGAGVGGLSAAIYLQAAGYQVDLFEKNSYIGGKMGRIDTGKYRFDVGPTIVMMPEIYRQVFSDSGVNPDDYFQMSRLNPFMDVYLAGKKDRPLSSDLVDITKTYEGVSSQDMAGFLAYLSDIYQRYDLAKDHFIARSFRSPWDFWNPKTLIQAFRLKTFSSSYQSLKKYLESEDLVKLLAFQTLYIGISPFNGPSIYNIIPMIELLYGVWYIQGGMYSYAQALERRFKELGGQIHLNTAIESVTFTNKNADGVMIGGVKHDYDAVVMNADFPYAMNHLIPDKAGVKPRRYQVEKINQMDYAISCMVIYLGLDRQYEHLNVHNLRMAEDFFKNIDELEKGILPDDPSFYAYYPSKIDDSMAPNGHSSLYVLAPVPNLKDFDDWNEQQTKDFIQKVFSRLASELDLPDLLEHIDYQQIYTPNDFKSEFNSAYGATFGLKPTLLQSNYFRPHNKYPYAQKLYFAGASAHPGAGVPIVLTSGELAAKEVMRDLPLPAGKSRSLSE
ncbi:phytoene desaturase family protein [Convivina intestini]|uniref:Phytoene desaturase n=1 Tax=Convivina intestini TaxID=1505726 RepID=A0A2U1DF87_9LACO|nr:phytoene desaturase family protein [Convivina intestini]PVY86337.1 phytoene desaturase [Convivina intestini]CAH1850783.1 4,4'-diapophytoene desaturase (4,4'-diaponeurosporene-forming) [Convivina intestini]SDB82647.1 phytoene desaturase [Leuconostocaceae bacterium R-53105]